MKRRRFVVLPLAEAVQRMQNGTLPDHAVAITIDDGWAGTYADMVPALAKRGMPATLYCDTASLLSGKPIPHVMARYLRRIHRGDARLSAPEQALYDRATDLTRSREARLEAAFEFARRVGADVEDVLQKRTFCYMTPDELRAARRAGLSVELHTHSHSLRDFSDSSITEEIQLNRNVLGALLDAEPGSFRQLCYPSGECRPAALRAIARCGIETATTLEPRAVRPTDHPLLLPRLLDGEHMTEIEFEAELCGLAEMLRRWRSREPSVLRPDPVATAT